VEIVITIRTSLVLLVMADVTVVVHRGSASERRSGRGTNKIVAEETARLKTAHATVSSCAFFADAVYMHTSVKTYICTFHLSLHTLLHIRTYIYKNMRMSTNSFFDDAGESGSTTGRRKDKNTNKRVNSNQHSAAGEATDDCTTHNAHAHELGTDDVALLPSPPDIALQGKVHVPDVVVETRIPVTSGDSSSNGGGNQEKVGGSCVKSEAEQLHQVGERLKQVVSHLDAS